IPGVRLAWEQPFLFEFALELPKPAHAVVRALLDDGLLAGLPLGRFAPQWERLLLVAVTETRTLAEIEQLAHALERALQACRRRLAMDGTTRSPPAIPPPPQPPDFETGAPGRRAPTPHA